MTFEGRAVCVPGDNVDTDVLYPGPFLNIEDPQRMKDHLFEGLDPGLRNLLGGETVLVVGENFGSGSSREHVPRAMKAWGVRCVLGRSFARIFYRNCINLGLFAVVSPEAAGSAQDGSWIRVEPGSGVIEVDGRAFAARRSPAFVLELVGLGGLVEWAQLHPPGTRTGG